MASASITSSIRTPRFQRALRDLWCEGAREDRVMRKPHRKNLSAEVKLAAEIAHLRSLGLKELRVCWKGVMGRTPPVHLLFAMVSYRIQANAYGDFSAETVKPLDRIGEIGGLALAAHADRRHRLPSGDCAAAAMGRARTPAGQPLRKTLSV